MLVVLIVFKLRLKTKIADSYFTDASVKCILINLTATIFGIHLHHNRIININTVAFDFGYLTFKSKIVLFRSPLTGTFTFYNLVHFKVVYPL